MEARCMKCKGPKEMKNGKLEQTKRGGYMMKGECTDCGTKMCKIVSKADAEAMQKAA